MASNGKTIEDQISYNENIKKELKTLKGLVYPLRQPLFGLSNLFSEAGEKIEEAGTINNKPFDEGKTLEKALEFENLHIIIEDVLKRIDEEIKKVQYQIDALRIKAKHPDSKQSTKTSAIVDRAMREKTYKYLKD